MNLANEFWSGRMGERERAGIVRKAGWPEIQFAVAVALFLIGFLCW